MRVAGLAPVEGIPGLENIDVTALVPGHMAYRAAMPRLLREVGWAVTSDEFDEIEDPVCSPFLFLFFPLTIYTVQMLTPTGP
jgi:hypothetical protein